LDGWCPRITCAWLKRIAQNMFICAPHAIRFGPGLAAMDFARLELEATWTSTAPNRAMMVPGLREAGFTQVSLPRRGILCLCGCVIADTDSRDLRVHSKQGPAWLSRPRAGFRSGRGHQTLRFFLCAQHTKTSRPRVLGGSRPIWQQTLKAWFGPGRNVIPAAPPQAER